MLLYNSTRNKTISRTASEAVVMGLAPDGGLFVPQNFPELPFKLEELAELSYNKVATAILSSFLTDYSKDEIEVLVSKAYNTFPEKPVPLKSCGNTFFLELFHGATSAFKDVALSLLPYLMTTSAKKLSHNEHIFILAATSGDTGKAAMAGFKDVPGTSIAVFYPENGTSLIQKLQMVTQTGINTYVIGLKGNFDDAQNGVKEIFDNAEIKNKALQGGVKFSSANSINIGRLLPQMVYYFTGYSDLIKQGVIKVGDPVNITVPTGNFGNILAAYYASRCGLPVNKFICASNRNNVLTDFFYTGLYDRRRDFFKTSSPSMDILISSNLERFLYHISDSNTELVASLMASLKSNGYYQLPEELLAKMSNFFGAYCDDKQAAIQIKKVFDQYGYIIDPHTAVANHALEAYREASSDNTPTLVAATASPFKFPRAVCEALNLDISSDLPDYQLLDALSEVSKTAIPENLNNLEKRTVLHNDVITPQQMSYKITQILQTVGK